MKFHYIPYLAQEIILKQMEIPELFFFSLTSSRAQRLARNRSFQSTSTSFKLANKDGLNSLVFEGSGGETTVITWGFKNSMDLERGKVQTINLNGKPLKCSFTFFLGRPIMICKDSMRRELPMSIHSHFCDLFNTSTDIQVLLNLLTLKAFPNTKKIKNLCIEGEIGCMKRLNYLLNNCEITNCLQIEHSIKELIEQSDNKWDEEKTSKLWKIDNLYLKNSEGINQDHFLRFEGKNVAFLKSHLKMEDIVEFMGEWVEGKKHKKLESLMVQSNVELRLNREILQRFQPHLIRADKRPAEFIFDVGMKGFLPHSIYWDFTIAHNIRRKTDGAKALFQMNEKEFLFAVWTPAAVNRLHEALRIQHRVD